MNITPISSNALSTDLQSLDALNFLEVEHPEAFDQIVAEFPEVCNMILGGSWFDVEAMGVDPEWGSWIADAIENTGFVWWDEGEPWGKA